MIRSRLLGLYSQTGSSASSSAPLHSSFILFQRPQPRGYSKATGYKNHRLMRVFPEDDGTSSPRSWTTYAIPAAILVFFSGAVIYIHHNDEKRAILKGSETSDSSSSNCNRPVIGGPFKLFDTKKNLVTESNFQGNWILMYFGYTSSPDVGPAEVQKMAKVIDILESEHNLKAIPIFVTIDPQRDSPAQLRAYLEEFDSRIVGLTGSICAIRQMAQEYRVYFKKVDEEGQDYLVQCSNSMYLLDPKMEIVRCYGIDYDERQLSDDIMQEVKKASK